jgi:undecaprenyl-diphosphatase
MIAESHSCSAAESAIWRRRTLLLIAVLLAVRWLYAACVPLELVADEACYWDWSRRLDWGYYSKPPLIAWIIRLATEVGGSTAWTVRTPAVLLGTLSLWWISLLAARLFDPRVGFWSAVLCAATPGNAVLGLLMTIDAPFLFCWGMSTYGLWRMLERGPRRSAWVFCWRHGCSCCSAATIVVNSRVPAGG